LLTGLDRSLQRRGHRAVRLSRCRYFTLGCGICLTSPRQGNVSLKVCLRNAVAPAMRSPFGKSPSSVFDLPGLGPGPSERAEKGRCRPEKRGFRGGKAPSTPPPVELVVGGDLQTRSHSPRGLAPFTQTRPARDRMERITAGGLRSDRRSGGGYPGGESRRTRRDKGRKTPAGTPPRAPG